MNERDVFARLHNAALGAWERLWRETPGHPLEEELRLCLAESGAALGAVPPAPAASQAEAPR